MNLDADIFIENNADIKKLMPTLCAITRKIRAESLRPLIELPSDRDQLIQIKRREMCKSNLVDLIDDLINLREVLDGMSLANIGPHNNDVLTAVAKGETDAI